MEDFSLSCAFWMCLSGGWKGGSQLSPMWKRAEIDVHPGGWSLGPSTKVKEGLDMTAQLMRVMSQDPH